MRRENLRHGAIPIRPSLLKNGTYCSLISCGWETWEKATCYHDLNIVCVSVCLHGRVSILIHHFSLLILHILAHISLRFLLFAFPNAALPGLLFTPHLSL